MLRLRIAPFFGACGIERATTAVNADSLELAMNRLLAGEVAARRGNDIGSIQRMGVRQGLDVRLG